MKNFEKLNKDEMKMILGGDGMGGGEPTCNCNNASQCTSGKKCYNCGSNGQGEQPWGYCND